MKNNEATKTVASTFGVLVGLAGMEHGFFEMLQGNVTPSDIMIDAIGPEQKFWEYAAETALTIVPNFLVTGILAIIFGLLVTIWAYAFINKKYGASASFVTPPQTQERSVGLQKFEHASVQAKLILAKREVRVGEDFNLEIQIGNVGKEAVLLVKVEEILPEGFEMVEIPKKRCSFEDAYLDMKGIQLDPLKAEEIKLVSRSFHKGSFEIRPRIVYVGESGEQMISEPDPVTIKLLEVVLPNRVTTGHTELDALLFGGIPKNFAVILTSPSCLERSLLIKNFLESGVKEGQVTFHVATSVISGVKSLAEEFPSNFYLFICNPHADKIIKSQPNVFKLKGVENLNDINIALFSALRRLDASAEGPRRACIEIVSDVLLQHHAVQTRRWLNALIPELKTRGFTTLTVMDLGMHSQQEGRAILDLFEGEINIYKKNGKRFLKIERMANQEHLNSELPLGKEKP